jgi:hypothetical protein
MGQLMSLYADLYFWKMLDSSALLIHYLTPISMNRIVFRVALSLYRA